MRVTFISSLVALIFLPSLLHAQSPPRVGVAIAIAVDRSGSIDDREMNLMIDGIAQALQNPDILDRIGIRGGIAVTTYTWESGATQNLTGWEVIRSAEDASRYADLLQANRPSNRTPSQGTGLTDHGQAVRAGYELHLRNPYFAQRMLLNVIMDGPMNTGRIMFDEYRTLALNRGITINALVVSDTTVYAYNPPVKFARDRLIGGFASFYIEVNGFEDFTRAFVKKLLLEIS